MSALERRLRRLETLSGGDSRTYVIELRGGYSTDEALGMLGINPNDDDEVIAIQRIIVSPDPVTGGPGHKEFLPGEPRLCWSGPTKAYRPRKRGA